MRRHYPSLSRYHFLDIPIATAAHAYPSGNIPASNPPQPQSQPQQQQQQQPTPLHLSPPPREESTRVQLQKQRLREQQQQQYQQYHAVVVSQRIPGLRTSAGG